MKDPQPAGRSPGNEDTYHGTRMDQQALSFHTRLHEWNEAQKLSSLNAGHVRAISAKERREVPMPVRRYVQIEHWARDVNKYYNPRTNGVTKQGLFMKIDISKYNMSPAKSVSEVDRNKSASSTKKPPTPASQYNRSASAGGSSSSRRFFGRSNDINSVHNNLLETQFHYSGQRREIYSANSSTRKTAESSKMKEGVPNMDTTVASKLSLKDSNSEARYSTSIPDDDEGSTSLKTESLAADKEQAAPHSLQPVISSRSWSNQMMNVISIDDCKLNCRYRPQKIKESRGPPIDYEEIDRKKRQAKTHQNQTNVNGVTSDNESGDGTETVKSGGSNSELPGDRSDVIHHDSKTSDKEGKDLEKRAESPASESSPVFFLEGETNRTGHKASETSESQDLFQSRAFEGSYGRITRLYGSSKDTKSAKEEKMAKKKPNRAVRISTAIDGVVKDRKVLNTMDRNFDVRVAFVGRTVIEEKEESKSFRRRHSRLRKHISNLLESKCSIQTNKYHAMRKQSISTEEVL